MYKPAGPITEVNGHAIKPGWFTSFRTSDHEAYLSELRGLWAMCITKMGSDRTTCGRCKGRGYTRKDGAIGCVDCGGVGNVATN